MNKISIQTHTGYLYRLLDKPIRKSAADLSLPRRCRNSKWLIGCQFVLDICARQSRTLQVAVREERRAGQQDGAVAEVDAATIAGYQEDGDAIGWKRCDATTLVSCRCANHTPMAPLNMQARIENSVLQHAYKKIHMTMHVRTCEIPGGGREASKKISAI